VRFLCGLALFSTTLLSSCQAQRTREVTVVIDGVTYKGTVTEQSTAAAPASANSAPVTATAPAQDQVAASAQKELSADKLLMTAKWPLNQPATQYPDETRSLNSGNPYTPKPIVESYRTIFGPNHLQFNTTMPVTVVDSRQTPLIFAPVKITTNWGSDDASHVPVLGGKIEGEDNPNGDRHILTYDTATGLLHELFGVTRDANGHYSALAYRRWDTSKPQVGKPGQNSADAAGLPIVPLLLRYNEAASGSIHHALRFTIALSRANSNGGVFTLPASHSAGQNWSSPVYMGMRLRLRGDFDGSKFSKMDQVIITCLKTYGMVAADNGISGLVVADDDRRWNQDDLQRLGGSLRLLDFIPVNSGPIIDSSGADAK
jgi:hypothetical protein